MNINIIKTLYINFKCLPFRQAIHLPIVLYNDIRIIRCTGKFVLNTDNVCFKMVQIGAHGSDMISGRKTTLDIAGQININGGRVIIGHGSLLRVESNAFIEFHENSIIGANNIVFSCSSITFCSNCLFSLVCQIMDSDPHGLYRMETGEDIEMTKRIIIGPDTWIGNHVIINKGTVLPKGVIVSAFSLCNKDYTDRILPYSVIGGVPAKILKYKIKRKYLKASFMDKDSQS
jgi:acetyltransferase-like isoleucine patch superfamily enzyme